jgi:phosphoribulokinase
LDTPASDIGFPHLCARFGHLSLVPALHALVTPGDKIGLATEFLYMSVRDTLGAGIYSR